MSLVTPQIKVYIETQSWIRRMFETAAELKAKYGAENVFDFSLGNPDVPPPKEVEKAIKKIAGQVNQPLVLGYCPNAGRPDVREALAQKVSEEQGLSVPAQNIIVTNGAAGALNALFRTILEPGDEVLGFAPYFVEYGFYTSNYGAFFRAVKTSPDTFVPDPQALENSITEKTRALIINSPNNPTGQVYNREQLESIIDVLSRKSKEYGRPIFLVSDEPYRFLTYDGMKVPALLPMYSYAVAVNSFSKSLSMAGARIGYLAAQPEMPGVETLMAGLTLSNRILGFVNAPVIGQLIIKEALNASVDIAIYEERRQAMADLLTSAGLKYTRPKGAFYFFPRVPQGYDDQQFVDALRQENIIAVPGKGFGTPGYVRFSYCVDKPIIENAADAFDRVMKKVKSR